MSERRRVDGLRRAAADEVDERLRALSPPHSPAGSILHDSAVARLPLSMRHNAALWRAGYRQVADLLLARPGDIAEPAGLDEAKAAALLAGVRAPARVPADRLRAISANPHAPPLLPRIDPRIVLAVARADTAEEEVYAAALQDEPRDTLTVLARLGVLGLAVPTYAELGKRVGLTGARVQQVVTAHEVRLRAADLRLPAVERLLAAGAGDRVLDRPGAWV